VFLRSVLEPVRWYGKSTAYEAGYIMEPEARGMGKSATFRSILVEEE
jgi:hypothetical protein